jgi:hypothetical protein
LYHRSVAFQVFQPPPLSPLLATFDQWDDATARQRKKARKVVSSILFQVTALCNRSDVAHKGQQSKRKASKKRGEDDSQNTPPHNGSQHSDRLYPAQNQPAPQNTMQSSPEILSELEMLRRMYTLPYCSNGWLTTCRQGEGANRRAHCLQRSCNVTREHEQSPRR